MSKCIVTDLLMGQEFLWSTLSGRVKDFAIPLCSLSSSIWK